MTNYYEILGVDKNASEDEIKKAYRKAASKHHPDREGGDTVKFQEVQEAYETLSDKTKKYHYDHPPSNNHGFNFNSGFEPNRGNTPEDIFANFFRHAQAQQARRNKDLRVNLSVSLESTLEAQKKSIDVQTTNGGHFVIDLDLPRGINSGATIKYPLMGDNFHDTLTRGDLYVIVTVLPHARFGVEGLNLVAEININAVEAMIGVRKTIIGLDGKEFAISLPAGCQHDTKFLMAKQGLYQMNVPFRGDLIVVVKVAIPTPTVEQTEVLRNIFNIKE